MAYILRITQKYKPENRREFLEEEAKFEALERRTQGFPKGKRSQPVSGAEVSNSLIWECEFATLADVQTALAQLANDPAHAELFKQQSPYITEIHTSIFEVLEF